MANRKKLRQVKVDWKINTTLFLTSQAISLFGTMLVQYAIMWHIVLKTQSGAMMMLYILVGVLPTLFTSLLGGVWADRYNKKHLINIADGAIGFVSLIVALSLYAGYNTCFTFSPCSLFLPFSCRRYHFCRRCR
jgi:DHA3 family macrolide efflux protein-like MFS transporter